VKNILLGLILSQALLLPLARKWELDIGKVIAIGLGVGLLAGLLTEVASFFLSVQGLWELVLLVCLILTVSSASFAFWFYRDPERIPPTREDIIVAPADGTIRYIKRVDRGRVPLSTKGRESVPLGKPLTGILPEGAGYLIGIAMTFLDVHVTRAPIRGQASFLEHVDGAFFSLKKADAPYRNERMIHVVSNGQVSVGLIHIASRLVRRIQSYIREGDHLELGQRIGMIKFGSQVDVVLPDDGGLRIEVHVGDRVLAGTTIIART